MMPHTGGETMSRDRESALALERLRKLVRDMEAELARLEGAPDVPAAAMETLRLEQVLEFTRCFMTAQTVFEAMDTALVGLLRLLDAHRAFASVSGVDRDAYARVEEELQHTTRRRVERAARTLAQRVGDEGQLAVVDPSADAELDALREGHDVGPGALVAFQTREGRGTLYVERDPHGRPFEPAEMQMLDLLGRYLAESLPATLQAEEQRQSKLQLALLNRLYEGLSQSLELDQVLDLIAEITLEVTEAERAFILLMAGTQLYFGAGRDAAGPLPQQSTRDISRSVCRKVVETEEGVYVYDMADSAEFSQARSVVSLRINSVIAVPLRSQAGLTGVLYVDSRSKLLTSLQQKLGVLTTVSHVASLAVESAKLYRQATVDGLTGTYVRSFFMLRLEEEIRRSQRYGRTFSLLVMDIDRFKTVNDSHGHQVGDDVLKAVADCIKRSIRGGVDMAGRYGGDELIVLLPETSADGARIVAERIRSVVAGSPVALPTGGSLDVTVSIGISTFPQGGDSASQLFAHADQALYAAKQAGRNCFRVYGS